MGADVMLPAVGVGLVGGSLVGLTGIGAGTVIAALLLVAYPGETPQIIVGSATLQAIAMKLVAVLARRQYRLREWRLGLSMAIGAAPLAVLGAVASHHVPAATLKAVLAWVLIGVGGLILAQAVHRWRKGDPAARERDPHVGRIGLFGAGVGFVAGLTSIGTGTLFVATLAGPLRIEVHRAVAAALVAGLLTLTVSGVTHALLGHDEPVIVAGAVLGSVPGVLFGTALSHRMHGRGLRAAVGVGIMIAATITLLRAGK